MVFPQRWHQSEGHSILGEKMKIYPQVLTFFIKPKTWLFHVVVLLTTATKWTKVKNARAGRAKLLFLPTKYANSWRSRCRRRCRCLSSLFAGNSGLLPSDVIDFALLPAKRFLAGNVLLLDVMWPRSNQWERALLEEKAQLYNNLFQWWFAHSMKKFV